jgi:hypothetical protein
MRRRVCVHEACRSPHFAAGVCGDSMAVSGTFVSFASSTIVAASPGTDFPMGTYEKMEKLMVNDRPVYRKRGENGLYLCFGIFDEGFESDDGSFPSFRGWMISSENCTRIFSVYAKQPDGTPDALCPDQVAEFDLWTGGLYSSIHYVRIKQAAGRCPLSAHNPPPPPFPSLSLPRPCPRALYALGLIPQVHMC